MATTSTFKVPAGVAITQLMCRASVFGPPFV
jgi:hypothetical protein